MGLDCTSSGHLDVTTLSVRRHAMFSLCCFLEYMATVGVHCWELHEVEKATRAYGNKVVRSKWVKFVVGSTFIKQVCLHFLIVKVTIKKFQVAL